MASYDSILPPNPAEVVLAQLDPEKYPQLAREAMGVRSLAELWAKEDLRSRSDREHRDRQTSRIEAALDNAIKDGSLKVTKKTTLFREKVELVLDRNTKWRFKVRRDEDFSSTPQYWVVHKDHFRVWLESKGMWPLPEGSLLSLWWINTPTRASQSTKNEEHGDSAEKRARKDRRAVASEIADDGDDHAADKRTRKDRLTVAIETAIARLSPNRERWPSTREIFDYLVKNDETGTVIDFTDDRLIWETVSGEPRDIKLRALADRLTRLKKKSAT